MAKKKGRTAALQSALGYPMAVRNDMTARWPVSVSVLVPVDLAFGGIWFFKSHLLT